MNRLLSFIAGICLWAFSINVSAFNLCESDICGSRVNDSESRTIEFVESIIVYCPIGTVPRLPYQVWVTYSDGKSGYRQTRWNNAALDVELEEANVQNHPIGDVYTISGYIIGDNTTEQGYPISAKIEVIGEDYRAPSATIAHAIPLTDIVIDGNNRLTSNRELAIKEIISWDVSQQLYNYRDTYGLSTEGYTRSDGWDAPDIKLKGHGSGHYMSALALA